MEMVDVTVHVDENLDQDRRTALVEKVREHDGVFAVGYHDDKPHLMVIEYNPDKLHAADLLALIKGEGVHAELIGL